MKGVKRSAPGAAGGRVKRKSSPGEGVVDSDADDSSLTKGGLGGGGNSSDGSDDFPATQNTEDGFLSQSQSQSQSLPGTQSQGHSQTTQQDGDEDKDGVGSTNGDAEGKGVTAFSQDSIPPGKDAAESSKSKRPLEQLDEVPLLIPAAVSKDNKASLLVSLRDESLDFSGDTGAVGRIAVGGKKQGRGLTFDLKGQQFTGQIIPSATVLVVGVGRTEAKVEGLFSEICQLDYRGNVFDSMGGEILKGEMDESYKFLEEDVNARGGGDDFGGGGGGAEDGGVETGGQKGGGSGRAPKSGRKKSVGKKKGGAGGKGRASTGGSSSAKKGARPAAKKTKSS